VYKDLDRVASKLRNDEGDIFAELIIEFDKDQESDFYPSKRKFQRIRHEKGQDRRSQRGCRGRHSANDLDNRQKSKSWERGGVFLPWHRLSWKDSRVNTWFVDPPPRRIQSPQWIVRKPSSRWIPGFSRWLSSFSRWLPAFSRWLPTLSRRIPTLIPPAFSRRTSRRIPPAFSLRTTPRASQPPLSPWTPIPSAWFIVAPSSLSSSNPSGCESQLRPASRSTTWCLRPPTASYSQA
jgi:hypothetical protein